MPTSEPLDVLFAHNRWANEQMFAACQPLTMAQFHQRFPIGPGSLHDALTHMAVATRGWCDALAGRESTIDPQPGQQRSVEQLRGLIDPALNELEALSTSKPLTEIITRSRNGRTVSAPLGGLLVHVITHCFHHRTQCLNMLRQLGIAPLPMSSVVEWIRTVDSPAS